MFNVLPWSGVSYQGVKIKIFPTAIFQLSRGISVGLTAAIPVCQVSKSTAGQVLHQLLDTNCQALLPLGVPQQPKQHHQGVPGQVLGGVVWNPNQRSIQSWTLKIQVVRGSSVASTNLQSSISYLEKPDLGWSCHTIIAIYSENNHNLTSRTIAPPCREWLLQYNYNGKLTDSS